MKMLIQIPSYLHTQGQLSCANWAGATMKKWSLKFSIFDAPGQCYGSKLSECEKGPLISFSLCRYHEFKVTLFCYAKGPYACFPLHIFHTISSFILHILMSLRIIYKFSKIEAAFGWLDQLWWSNGNVIRSNGNVIRGNVIRVRLFKTLSLYSAAVQTNFLCISS